MNSKNVKISIIFLFILVIFLLFVTETKKVLFYDCWEDIPIYHDQNFIDK